jgi:hypothetical protein
MTSQVSEPFCPICGDRPTNKELIDDDPFCGIPGEIGWAILRGKPTHARRSSRPQSAHSSLVDSGRHDKI